MIQPNPSSTTLRTVVRPPHHARWVGQPAVMTLPSWVGRPDARGARAVSLPQTRAPSTPACGRRGPSVRGPCDPRREDRSQVIAASLRADCTRRRATPNASRGRWWCPRRPHVEPSDERVAGDRWANAASTPSPRTRGRSVIGSDSPPPRGRGPAATGRSAARSTMLRDCRFAASTHRSATGDRRDEPLTTDPPRPAGTSALTPPRVEKVWQGRNSTQLPPGETERPRPLIGARTMSANVHHVAHHRAQAPGSLQSRWTGRRAVGTDSSRPPGSLRSYPSACTTTSNNHFRPPPWTLDSPSNRSKKTGGFDRADVRRRPHGRWRAARRRRSIPRALVFLDGVVCGPI